MREFVFCIEAQKADKSTIILTWRYPKRNISSAWLQNTWLPAAAPIFDIVKILSAYYSESITTSIINDN